MPRILIAEDDELQGAMLKSALATRGYEVEAVTDGLEAVRRLRTGRYDVALLDYNMPVVDGLAAAELMQEFLTEESRPRLIAVTASAERLNRDNTLFDCVVSKASGVPAVIEAVDASMSSVVALNTVAIGQQLRRAEAEAGARKRRRWLFSLAALPALGMTAAFIGAFGWASQSMLHADAAATAAHRTVALSTASAALVGAVQDTESAQRTFLATGLASHHEAFEADLQHVDQLMVSGESLSADGAPGFGATEEPPPVIAAHLRGLAKEAEARVSGPPATVAIPLSSVGPAAAERLRDWASTLVNKSQNAVYDDLKSISHDVGLVLTVLAGGVCFGLVVSGRLLYRGWRGSVRKPAMRAERPRLLRIGPPVATGLSVKDAKQWRLTGKAA